MQVAKRPAAIALRNKIVMAMAAMMAAGSAMADTTPTPPDPAVIVAYLVATGVVMVAIANAKLMMELGIKAFRWIRQALGG